MTFSTQRLKAGLCALFLGAAAFMTPALASSYIDVADDAWYASAVESMRSQGIMQGTGANTFSPSQITDRATVVTVLWKIAGSPATQPTTIFSDVPTDRWYAQAVAWAVEQGITYGNGSGQFRPADQITREQLAAFFYRYDLSLGNDPAMGVLDLYLDANKVSSWAVAGMRHAIGTGIVEGSDYLLSPQATASRAELAVMLDRILTPAAG